MIHMVIIQPLRLLKRAYFSEAQALGDFLRPQIARGNGDDDATDL